MTYLFKGISIAEYIFYLADKAQDGRIDTLVGAIKKTGL